MAEESDFFVKLQSLNSEVLALMPVAAGRGAEHIRATAAPLTPVRSGQLVGSAGVTVHGDEARCTYPGPYARRQHFELTWRHTVGQALYLEQPMATEAEKVLQIMRDTLSEAF